MIFYLINHTGFYTYTTACFQYFNGQILTVKCQEAGTIFSNGARSVPAVTIENGKPYVVTVHFVHPLHCELHECHCCPSEGEEGSRGTWQVLQSLFQG